MATLGEVMGAPPQPAFGTGEAGSPAWRRPQFRGSSLGEVFGGQGPAMSPYGHNALFMNSSYWQPPPPPVTGGEDPGVVAPPPEQPNTNNNGNPPAPPGQPPAPVVHDPRYNQLNNITKPIGVSLAPSNADMQARGNQLRAQNPGPLTPNQMTGIGGLFTNAFNILRGSSL